ncbi:MAG: cobalamin biosynthesis protein [Candidatus Korarchaeota archaeon]|nr:cobalamin biosynthesis protein [Candidatus Korarchaeota archaeon]
MSRKALILILVLVLVSPLFGVIGSEIVGYHEPLDVAAELIGLSESEPVWQGVLPDYTVPGLPDVIGYIIAGFVGVGILLLPAILRGKEFGERN